VSGEFVWMEVDGGSFFSYRVEGRAPLLIEISLSSQVEF